MPTFSPEEKARILKLMGSRLDHDLRSGMNVILGYCSMLKEALSSNQVPPGFLEDLGHIEAAGEDLVQLNNRISDLLKVQDGAWKPTTTEFDLDQVVDAVIRRVSARFPRQHIELKGSAHLDQGDAAAIENLLLSIIDRLCRTSVPSGISIEVSMSGHDATVDMRCVMDTPEKRKLVWTLEGMSETVSEMNSIQDFDNYYCSIMGELAGAETSIDVEHLACRVTFRDMIDHTGAAGGESPAG